MTAVAITEPQSGSDVGSMKTKAVRDGNGAYVLNGEKCYITFAPVADYILVFARVGDPRRRDQKPQRLHRRCQGARRHHRQERAQARPQRNSECAGLPGEREGAGREPRR